MTDEVSKGWRAVLALRGEELPVVHNRKPFWLILPVRIFWRGDRAVHRITRRKN